MDILGYGGHFDFGMGGKISWPLYRNMRFGGLSLGVLSASPSHICNIGENDDDPSRIASDSTQ